jgi:competence protein ComEA
MTWYDGGPAPDPTRRDPLLPAAHDAGAHDAGAHDAGAHDASVLGAGSSGAERADAAVAAGTGRARLRAAAEVASAAVGDREPPDDDPFPAPGLPAEGARPRLLDAVRWRVPSRTAVVALAALLLVGGAVALRAAAQPTGEPVSVEEPTVLATAEPEPTASTDATVWVHVVGQVTSPGVVALPAGSRVGEAVAAAGGALPDADLAGLNLAAVVPDGAQVRVPAPGEAPEGAAVEAVGGGPAADGTVDVNTAGSGELQTLPGIGPVLADRIVAWRTEHGAFSDVDALRDVPGIGPAVLSQLRDLVRV